MKTMEIKQSMLPISFGRQTVMVGAYTPQVLVFENSKDLDLFKNVIEEVAEYIADNDKTFSSRYTRWFIDPFEEEAYMVDDDEEDRNLTLISREEMDDENFSNEITTKFGVLNSKDCYTGPNVTTIQIEMLNMALTNNYIVRTLKLTDEEIQKLEIVTKLMQDDIDAAVEGTIFKVDIVEGDEI